MRKYLCHFLTFIPVVAALTGCGLVDEDLGDCETEYKLDYELRLVTNLTTEFQTELSMAADLEVAAALRSYLKEVFTDYAHDVDLSFYDVVRDEAAADSLRLHHERHIMDANQSSFTLFLPVRKYMHLAVANLEKSGAVYLENDAVCHGSRLQQDIRDTVGCHKTGLFTARLPMDIQEGRDQNFDVRLYMANCASALVIDTVGSHLRDVRVFASGFANAFHICDSTYRFQYSPVVRPDPVPLDVPGRLCYATVTFPSRDVHDTRTIIDSEDPSVSELAEGSLWRYVVYVTMPDGTVTASVLGVFRPLRPGHFRIIKVKVLENGAVQTGDPAVAVSVTLDWTPGQEYNVDM